MNQTDTEDLDKSQRLFREFMLKMAGLMREYGVEITADDHWQGFAECGQDIQIELEIEGVYYDLKFGKYLTPDALIDKLNSLDE